VPTPIAASRRNGLSFRTRLQLTFVGLGLAAIAITGWESSARAAAALEEATVNRLAAIRETRASELERYFDSLLKHVVALSNDESSIVAVEEMRNAWAAMAPADAAADERLGLFYRTEIVPRVNRLQSTALPSDAGVPADPRSRRLQSVYLADNPHPIGAKDLLLAAAAAGEYGTLHARYHPMFHRYQSAFGFYDILLISAVDGRIVYSVMKETDLGASLDDAPFRETNLARAYRQARDLTGDGDAVLVDYAPYIASYYTPAAFAAAPIRRAGATVGVLAIQVSISEVNRVMSGDARWREEGLGTTGHSYLVGSDLRLRSDLRRDNDTSDVVSTRLLGAGMSEEALKAARASGTGILTLPVTPDVAELVKSGARGSGPGVGWGGVPVLRSYAPLNLAGLPWTVVAEIDRSEAFAPVSALRRRIFLLGLGVGLVFLLTAAWVATSVTRPVLALAAVARRLGRGDLHARATEESTDEIGQLTTAFNRMSEDLRRTMVSKQELEVLAGRLITAQEDERTRVARELHDDLSQRLAAVAIDTGRLERILAGSGARHPGFDDLKRKLAGLADDIHGLSRRLHPAMLDDLGLAAAVETECRAFVERGGPVVETEIPADLDDLPRETRLAAYRIVQEALRNIVRHANAEEVRLTLQKSDGLLTVEVTDDGRGFARGGADWHPGIGLASMEERTRLLGGTFEVASGAGLGTRIRAQFPLGTDGETTNHPR
jgi:methyl-accepting chemotaxis protein